MKKKKIDIVIKNITDNDIIECIDHIIDDNKFDQKEFFKECGISHLVKNLKLDHLVMICRHKGYTLEVKLPEDTLTLVYHLENNEVEVKEEVLNNEIQKDIPEEVKKEKDLDFPF